MINDPYKMRLGSQLDQGKLLQFMQWSYGEIYPNQNFDHLKVTVEKLFSDQTPLWWIDFNLEEISPPHLPTPSDTGEGEKKQSVIDTIGCLWLGKAIDQGSGESYTYIFLIYVKSEHRKKGLGKKLINMAENWAKERGDRQIGLQVFINNKSAINLYEKLGYETESLSMIKRFGG